MGIFLRLIHVSDLHFGDVLHIPRWAVWGWIPGLRTHNERVARELSNSVRTQRLNNPVPMHVVATGDLTTWGRPQAFSLVLTYLRSQIYTGGSQVWLGLNDSSASVVPGNHDIWGGKLLGLSPNAYIPPLARGSFNQFFNRPSPSAVYLSNGEPFPYQWYFHGQHPTIYIYGLDSTRVDLAPNPLSHNVYAEGFVDSQQLTELEILVNNEPNEPRIRIAAIHHPLAYPQTTNTPTFETLINLDSDVLPTLQRLGFAVALCGHQHKGFIRQTSTMNATQLPIHVFSTGTSTQAVYLSSQEIRLLSHEYSSLNDDQKIQWLIAAQKCNEYRIYDFEITHNNPHQLYISVHSYRFDPNKFTFVENVPVPPSIDFTNYIIY